MDVRIGAEIRRLEETGSTNDEAKRLAADGAPEGTVVVAERQTAGRGRRGRAWASVPGNLFLSVILRPRISPAAAPPLAPAMGLAVALGIEEVAPLATELKWPNDVRVNGRKVAGILAESLVAGSSLSAVVVGIGINVGAELPPELAEIATTLSREAVRNVRKSEVEAAVLDSLGIVYARFLAGGFPALHADWSLRDALRGQRLTIEAGDGRRVEGEGAGIAEDGGYQVRQDGGGGERGVVVVTAGEVL